MGFRQIDAPALRGRLSNVMAQPSSSQPHTHYAGLDAYHRLGGNCILLHGEGDETHSRRAAGDWLRAHGLRDGFFLCAQVCHTGWDARRSQAIDRYTPAALREDITGHLDLLGTDYLDLVYLDDNPQAPCEPMLDALAHEAELGRIRAFGVRNWDAQRLRQSQRTNGHLAAVVTTELSLLKATEPVWQEYLPFTAELEQTVRELGLAVFAHISDLNLGQCLFGDEDAVARLRLQWISRWEHADNAAIKARMIDYSRSHGLTLREINIAWVLNRAYPVIGVIDLPALLTERWREIERASQWLLGEGSL